MVQINERTGIWAVCAPVAYDGTNKTVRVTVTLTVSNSLLVHLKPQSFPVPDLFLSGLIFYPDDRGRMFLSKVGTILPN